MERREQLREIQRYGLEPFRVGNVINPLGDEFKSSPAPVFVEAVCCHPARLQSTVIDLRHVAQAARPMVYTPGAIIFAADIPTVVQVNLSEKIGEIRVDGAKFRTPIIVHTAMIMRAALGVADGLRVSVRTHGFFHVGLGSSAAMQVSVGAAINRLYGDPIPPDRLVTYLAQNYGEELHGNDESLIPVQSTGSSAAVGLLGGGMMVIAGEAKLIKRIPVPDHFSYVIGVPEFVERRDGLEAFASEAKVFADMLAPHSRKRALETSYRVLHRLLPAMSSGDWATIGDVLWQIRHDYGSFDRLEQMTPGFRQFIMQLSELRSMGLALVLSPTSAGPGVFALTADPVRTKEFFEEHGARTIVATPNNHGIHFETKNRC